MSTHIFEQAAHILEVAIDATPTAIRAAYEKAKTIAAKPIHLIEMAYEVMITATADYRIQAVKAFYKETCFAKAIAQIQETPEDLQGNLFCQSYCADSGNARRFTRKHQRNRGCVLHTAETPTLFTG